MRRIAAPRVLSFCSVLLLASCGGSERREAAKPAPMAGLDGVHRAALDLSFAPAIDHGRARRADLDLGQEQRSTLLQLVSGGFSAAPVEVDGRAMVAGAIGLKSFGLPVAKTDRPLFRLEADGPRGSARLLERTAVSDFPADAWQPYRVRIPARVGSPVTLRFSVENPDAHPAIRRATPLWAEPRLLVPAQAERPNVLLVVFDTLRADRTGVYGYERDTTPFLDELAQRGATVGEAVASYPSTLTSHWSLFTALTPRRHGIYPGTGKPAMGPENPLARILRDEGYLTAAFTEGAYVHSIFGFAAGFDSYHNGSGGEIGGYAGEAAATFARARRWLGDNRESRFFLFLHTYQVHAPYDPPPEYLQLFEDAYEGRWKKAYPVADADDVNEGTAPLAPRELAHLGAMYDAEIRYLDDTFRELWHSLEALGVLDDTIVVVTSDHGEDLMEHGWLHHGTTLYDPALLVPLVIIWPGEVRAGARLDCQRPLVDVMPTVLELAGVAVPPGLEGRSFAREARTGVCRESRAAYSELVNATYPSQTDVPLASVRADGWKLITHSGGEASELFDLARDPGERENLGPTGDPNGARLAARLEAYLASGSGPPAAGGALPSELRDRLRGLGYVE